LAGCTLDRWLAAAEVPPVRILDLHLGEDEQVAIVDDSRARQGSFIASATMSAKRASIRLSSSRAAG